MHNGKPRKLLEIGSGSGAWAIQAAEAYPDADVLAIDINPLPARPLPSNVRFQRLDIMDPSPFAAGSFDIVHVRLVLRHVGFNLFPHPTITVIPRIIDPVTPRGWLLIEVDFRHGTACLENAPGLKGGFTGVITSMKSHQGDPHFGPNLNAALERSSAFSEIKTLWTVLTAIMEVLSKDPMLAGLSKTIRQSLMSGIGVQKLNPKTVVTGGLTREVQEVFIADMGAEAGGDWSYSLDMYFAWVRKHVV
ncbi:Methyltransferase str3 [Mycena sanguinolenta]|uniref:Methyltransferase str3 n=1 Tax=Mycena sanguinolenta TaxID=230812 RepID=A0A8H6XUL7_9AGAR|nr:Methyltransferase str3 [Mycena sanguinolenta]